MKIAGNVIGALLVLIGIVWTLQGANILPGSFMTGQPEWFVAGIVAIIVGGWLLRRMNSGTGQTPPEA